MKASDSFTDLVNPLFMNRLTISGLMGLQGLIRECIIQLAESKLGDVRGALGKADVWMLFILYAIHEENAKYDSLDEFKNAFETVREGTLTDDLVKRVYMHAIQNQKLRITADVVRTVASEQS